MEPLPDHSDLTATGCITQRGIVGEAIGKRLQAGRNISREWDLRRRCQLTLHEAVKALLATLKIAETPLRLQRQCLLKRTNPYQKPLERLMVQAGAHLA